MSRDVRKLKERVARSLARQDYEEALEACLALRRLEPADDRTLLKLGELYQRLERIPEALSAFRELLDFYADDGRLVRAISVAKMILQLAPGDERAQKKLALLYSARGLPASSAVRSVAREVRHAVEHGAAPEGEVPAPAAAAPSRPAPPPPPVEAAPGAIEADGPGPLLTDPHTSLEDLAAQEDPFAASPEEEARRQLAAAELADLDLEDLDLAFVELSPEAGPQAPPTPLFSDLAPEELHAVLRQVRMRRFQPGEVVVRQADEGTSVFVVSDGEVEVRVERGDGGDVQVATLGEGDFFGEFGMFADGRRHATVAARTEVELLEIRHSDLLEIAVRHPRMRRVLAEFYRTRALDSALAASRLFGGFGADERKEVAGMVAEERHMAGSTVLQEGDDGAGLYLVKQGRLRVQSRGLADDPLPLAELGPGDFFGEISLLSGSPITADVVADGPVELLKLSRREVLALCERHPELRQALEQTGQRRLHESIDRLSESGLV